jgi:phosphatidylserine decarboxylase
MFAREGYPFILGGAALAAIAFAFALRLRSWPLWLAAIVLTIIALWVAWFFRDPARQGERGPNIAVAPADGVIARRTITDSKNGEGAVQGSRMGLIRFGSRVDIFLPLPSSLRVTLGQRTVAGQTVIADLPSL